MLLRMLLSIVVVACAATAQRYDGPRPPKPDLPYIRHAETLVPTEAAEAKAEKKKDDTRYTIDGANSAAKTPLAAPIFIMQSGRVVPESLQLFKLESKDGHREFALSKNGEPMLIKITKLDGGLSRFEPDDGLEPGEYALLVGGSNQVFCFAVF